jgi:hypothetical protein
MLLRKNNTESALESYKKIRNLYKRTFKQKRMEYRLVIRRKIESCRSASDLWKEINSLKDSKSCFNNIKPEVWRDYFCTLLNVSNITDEEHKTRVQEFITWHNENCMECNNKEGSAVGLNRNIMLEEVESVISKLENKKSPGLDGITNECIKNCKVFLVPLLCQLFNKVLETGIYPDMWCSALIVPIHKSGSTEDKGNYRGISLLSCISKIFTSILNNRLQKWAEENDRMFEEQGGFTKGKGTVDQIFILQSLVSKYLCKERGRCYNIFIDFSKAFDTVPHKHMFFRLINEGCHGRVVTVLQNMYSKLKSSVQSGRYNVSEAFHCSVGTRQGCMLSPFLFIFYLNEFVKVTKEQLCEGIYLDENYPNVNMLLYADDVVIVGDHIGRVQNILNILNEFCGKWGLKVNMLKTKMMVYRKGGIVKRNEKCYFDGTEIELAKYYKYLGVLLSSRLSWSPAQTMLAAQGSKAMYIINKVNFQYDFPYNTSKCVFDKCIAPILTYGSEIWGASVHNSIESVQLRFCRMQLGVGSKTPTVAVLGDCGTFPLYVRCKTRVLKYWLKLISLPENSLLKAAYNMQYRLALAGKHNWAKEVKDMLYVHGFGYIWEEQVVVSQDEFILVFSQRLRDSYIQNWNIEKYNTPKLNLYNVYKDNFCEESYLSINVPRRLRRFLAKFRTTSVALEIEMGRRYQTPREDRLCKLCSHSNINRVEDEYHFLLECSAYMEARQIYIGEVQVNLYSFRRLMATEDTHVLINLANFVSTALEIRERRLKNYVRS